MIDIDGVNIFTSNAYQWSLPYKSQTELIVETGDYALKVNGSIRNISITTYE